MRLLPSLLLVALLVLLSPLALCTAPSPNATVLENVRALPCLSKLSRYLNLSYNAPIRALLSTCSPDNATVTLFAPTDSAVTAAHARIDALLRRSGYPPLEEIKRNITRAFNESESAGEIGDDDLHSAVDFHLAQAEPHLELLVASAGEGCTPWWNRTRSGGGGGGARMLEATPLSASLASAPDVVPPGLNITELLIAFCKANTKYHILNGTHLTTGFVAHQFLPTLLSNDSNFVALGGDPQRMHIENLTASMHMQPFGYAQQFVEEDVSVTSSVRAALGRLLPGISLAEVPINMSESTEPRITPIAILFGVAADPLSPDVAQAVLSNSSAREYGAARCIADVVVPDIISSNGVLHVIDRMLLLPMNLSFVLFKANKTAFLTALNDSGVLDEIEALENITVLAPTNAAWEAATARLRLNASTGNSTQFGEGGGLNESDARETLRTVLLMHVINGSFYPTDLSEGGSLPLKYEEGSNYTVSVQGDSLTINGSRVIKKGILLRNGVMYVIDRVMLPANMTQAPRGARPPPPPLPAGTQPANRSTEVSCNVSSVPILPPLPTASINATKLGCPASDLVCATIDFHFLRCATQRHLMSTRDAQACPPNATIDLNSTFLPPIPVTLRCFNPQTHACINGYFLCPAQFSLCGVQCYDPNEFTCYTTWSLCPAQTPFKCGEACYSSANYTCEEGRLVSANSTAGGGVESGGGSGGFSTPAPHSAPNDDPPSFFDIRGFSMGEDPTARSAANAQPRLVPIRRRWGDGQ